MPNWVYTTLFIEGKDSELKEFADFIRNDNYYNAEDDPAKRVHLFDFGKLIPRPAGERENWYNWNCNNWGTKWNACNVYIDNNEEGVLRYEFETAWGRLSDELWAKMKEKFPSLKFDLSADEEGGFFYSDTDYGNIVDFEGCRYQDEEEEDDE